MSRISARQLSTPYTLERVKDQFHEREATYRDSTEHFGPND